MLLIDASNHLGRNRHLLDTSVFIARESGRQLDERRRPEKVAISVVTLADLQAGVLAASEPRRALATLDILAGIAPVPIDAGAARHCAHALPRPGDG